MDDCLFCKIVANKIPSSRVYEDGDLLAFMDIQPVESGHLLIIPKTHCQYMSEVPDETLTKIMLLAKKLQKALRISEIKAEDINLFLADGVLANQEVPHFHLHLIPRYKNDGFGFKFREDYKIKPARELLDKQAQEIANAVERDSTPKA